jgi:hypothetical protein
MLLSRDIFIKLWYMEVVLQARIAKSPKQT